MAKRSTGIKHFKDVDLLRALGRHCQRLRVQKGYSIDRLARESEQLSTSVIHRLESGAGAVTVSALFRYAKALDLLPKNLLDFEAAEASKAEPGRSEVLAPDHPRVKAEAHKRLLPLYSLKAAAGYFGAGREVRAEGWIEVSGRRTLDRKMFVARAVGDSMSPRILSGDLLVFRAQPAGSRQGKIVLAQYRGPADPDTGGSFTVKQYHSSKVIGKGGSWAHQQIVLSPLNPDFEPIVLHPKDAHDFQIVAEYLFTV